MTNQVLPRSCKGVYVKRLTNGLGAWHKRRYNAFTLIELIVVVSIIIILAGLVLSTAGYARKKSARARAETEIAALSAACENYKADKGIYPQQAASTDILDAKVSGDPRTSTYRAASLYLYKELSGDSMANRNPTNKSYMVFKPNMLFPADQTQNVQYIQDPFGYSYGYSTANQVNVTKGYNPTFDLWSTAGLTADPGSPDPMNPDPVTPQWIKNW